MNRPKDLKSVVVAGSQQPAKPGDDIAALLANPGVRAQLAAALPRHITAERLARVALTEVRRSPALAQCDRLSLLGSLMLCAQLGLEPGGPLGQAYLVPFRNQKTGRLEAQFVVGYRGLIDLVRRSGQVRSIEARAVYEGDQFACEFGLSPRLLHRPDWDNPNRAMPDKLRFVYAVAHLRDGGYQFEVMGRREIEAARAHSRVSESSPWQTHYEAMALKTVIRRLCRLLPMSIELATAIEQDERAEAGLPQETTLVEPLPEISSETAASETADGEQSTAGQANVTVA